MRQEEAKQSLTDLGTWTVRVWVSVTTLGTCTSMVRSS